MLVEFWFDIYYVKIHASYLTTIVRVSSNQLTGADLYFSQCVSSTVFPFLVSGLLVAELHLPASV